MRRFSQGWATTAQRFGRQDDVNVINRQPRCVEHSHVSALIASGLDVLTISRRLGHASPVVTLSTYAHLCEKTDTAAATALEAAKRTGPER